MVRFGRCLVLFCAFAVIGLSGCAVWSAGQRASVGLNYPHASGENMSLSSYDHYHDVSRISAQDARALVDDLDLLFLTERPTRLTRWHTR